VRSLKAYKRYRFDEHKTEKSNSKLNLIPSLRPVLYVNTVLIVIIAIVLFFIQAVPVSRAEPILAYHVGALYIAFAPALVLVASRFRNDREWLMIPIVMDLAEFLNSLFQVILVVTHADVQSDPNAAVPLVVTGVLSAYYILCYRQLPHKQARESESSTSGSGELNRDLAFS